MSELLTKQELEKLVKLTKKLNQLVLDPPNESTIVEALEQNYAVTWWANGMFKRMTDHLVKERN